MTVIYFTATGNSLAVAKRIADRCISAVGLLQNKDTNEISDPEGIGLLMPVYFGQVPGAIVRLLDSLVLHAPYLFAVLTYGEIAGRATLHIRRLTERAGIRLDYIRSIKMVDNNFTIVNVEKQVAETKRKRIPEHLEEIAGDIARRRKFVEKPGIIGKLVGLIEEKMPQNPKFDSGFSVETDRCTSCGTCVKICPNANISLTDGQPRWHGNCLKCTACYHNCPHGAIRYRKEHSRYCYRNSAVSLREIIEANCRLSAD